MAKKKLKYASENASVVRSHDFMGFWKGRGTRDVQDNSQVAIAGKLMVIEVKS